MVLPLLAAGAAANVALGFLGKKKAKKGAQIAAGAEQRIEELQRARQRKGLIREAEQALGQQAVASAASGVESSSQVTGRSGILNQLQSSLAFINATEDQSNLIRKGNQKVAQGEKIAGIGSAIGGLTSGLFG